MTTKLFTLVLLQLLAWQTPVNALTITGASTEGMRILLLIHSRTGNTLAAAEKIKVGLEHNALSHVDIKRVPSFAWAMPSSQAVAALPIATHEELSSYDHIIFGSPVYFFSPAAAMMEFVQQSMDLWRNETLKGKQVAVFFASNGNGVQAAVETLRTSLRALHMESDTLNNACPIGAADWEAFGRCLSERMTTGSTPTPIELPPAPAPVGNYKPYRIANNLVFINQIALSNGKVLYPGIIGTSVTEEQAKISTHQAMLNVLAVLNQAVNGDLSRVKQVVEISGFFNAQVGYTMHSSLLNEASALAVLFFGSERGSHARAAFGVSSLPLDSPVEIKAIFEIMP
jgi:NAD(P)H dehydrogenase (quinone)